jgi:hypothetical protein
MRWLLEDPTPIYWMLGVLAVALVFATFITKRLIYAGGVGVVLLLGGLAWLIDYLVVTDREAVAARCFELADAAEKGEVERLGEILSRDCSASIPMANIHVDSREELLAHARRHLPREGRREIKVWVVDITSSRDGRSHVCHCDIRVSGDFGPYVINLYLVKADFTFQKEPDGQWRVREMRVQAYQQQ